MGKPGLAFGVSSTHSDSVLGSYLKIALLLSRHFLKLILVRLAVAPPLAYLVMNRWLDRFAYRFEPGAFEFILAALAVVLIAATTVSYQAIRTTIANPVDSLCYD